MTGTLILWELRRRAHWLIPLGLLVLLALIKDYPPPSCERS
jgi:hypothetical protein